MGAGAVDQRLSSPTASATGPFLRCARRAALSPSVRSISILSCSCFGGGDHGGKKCLKLIP